MVMHPGTHAHTHACLVDRLVAAPRTNKLHRSKLANSVSHTTQRTRAIAYETPSFGALASPGRPTP